MNKLVSALFKNMSVEYHSPGDIVITQNTSILDPDSNPRSTAAVFFVIEGKYKCQQNINLNTMQKQSQSKEQALQELIGESAN